jgi:hypothetical protein
MFKDLCYLCNKPIPAQQSFYEDHGVRVCLECYKDAPRCKKCRFPSLQLKMYPGLGSVCEFCDDSLVTNSGMQCYLCEKPIPTWASFYSDYDKTVCQDCFKYAKRCFLCRFPTSVEYVQGLGDVCEFCHDSVLKKESHLEPFYAPLKAFLEGYRHHALAEPKFQWVDWKIILGMQMQASLPQEKIKFLDEYLHHSYPLYYFREKFYVILRIPHQLFMVHLSGQLVAHDICQKYGQAHLIGSGPFHKHARGWVHWVAYSTAQRLQYTQIQKNLSRRPESEDVVGDFAKFLAMAEYRKPRELVTFAHRTLDEFAERYL